MLPRLPTNTLMKLATLIYSNLFAHGSYQGCQIPNAWHWQPWQRCQPSGIGNVAKIATLHASEVGNLDLVSIALEITSIANYHMWDWQPWQCRQDCHATRW